MDHSSIFTKCSKCNASLLEDEIKTHFCQFVNIERWAWVNMSIEKQQEILEQIYQQPHTRLNLVAPEHDSFSNTVTYTRKEWSRFSKEMQEKLINRSAFYEGEIILTGLTKRQEIQKRVIDFILKRKSKEKKAKKIQKKLLKKKSRRKGKMDRVMNKLADEITPSDKKRRRFF